MLGLPSILSELGYNPKWLEYGLLNSKFWEDQYQTYQTSPDKNLEHYRFEAFRALLDSVQVFMEPFMSQYIELAMLDHDRTMGASALGLLAQSDKLTVEQLQELTRHVAYQQPFLQEVLSRSLLLREITAQDVTDALIERCLASKDDLVQRALLGRIGTNAEQLALLMDGGANRAIRNMAAKLLRFR